jgi:hypothetical protein
MVATLIEVPRCQSCEQRHVLCLDNASGPSNKEYQYLCPTTRETVRFTTNQWGKEVPRCPHNSVRLVEVDGEAGA